MVMAAILDLCKLGMMKGFYAEMNVISVFLAPKNMGVDTKIKFIRVLDNEIQVKIGSNGGHFGFMQIRHLSTWLILVNF